MTLRKLLLGTAFALGAGAAFAASGPQPGVNSPWSPVWTIPIDSLKWTYALGFELSPLSAQQDLFQICGGNSTNVVRVKRIEISGRATAQAAQPIFVAKRSSGTIGGQFAPQTPFLSATVTGTPLDANNQTPGTAIVSAWQTDTGTGGPQTLGTLVGMIAAGQMFLGNLTTGPANNPLTFVFGEQTEEAILRSATQCLAVNLSGTTNAGNLYDVRLEWTEE